MHKGQSYKKRSNKKETWELIKLSRQGNTKAKERVINENIPFVYHLANNYRFKSRDDRIDAINSGMIGLLKSIEVWEPARGAFSTCSQQWIIKHINMFLYDNRLIRIPFNQHVNKNKIERTKSQLFLKLGREPTQQEILNNCDVSKINMDRIAMSSSTIHSFESSIPKNDKITYGNILESKERSDILIDEKKTNNNVLNALNMLHSERKQNIVKIMFGLESGEPLSLTETSKRVGVSKERVRQIKEEALKTLKNSHILQEEYK